MIVFFKQLTLIKLDGFVKVLTIFLIGVLAIITSQTALAESLASEDIKALDVVMVDELEYLSFIDELPDYDHVVSIELNHDQAQELLEQANSENLSYSMNSKQILSIVGLACVSGSAAISFGLISPVFSAQALLKINGKFYPSALVKAIALLSVASTGCGMGVFTSAFATGLIVLIKSAFSS